MTHMLLRLIATLAIAASLVASAAAAELVMFRTAGCPYCAAWDKAIGPVYPKTDIGKRLPLRPSIWSAARTVKWCW